MDIGLVRTDLAPDRMVAVQQIADLDFDRVKARMIVDHPTSPEEMARFEREVKRFLALAALERNFYVVSERVDTLWHYFVLHTREYRAFCAQTLGFFLHHIPILPEERMRWVEDFRRTKQTYAKYFGTPPADLWNEADIICWDGDDEVVDRVISQLSVN